MLLSFFFNSLALSFIRQGIGMGLKWSFKNLVSDKWSGPFFLGYIKGTVKIFSGSKQWQKVLRRPNDERKIERFFKRKWTCLQDDRDHYCHVHHSAPVNAKCVKNLNAVIVSSPRRRERIIKMSEVNIKGESLSLDEASRMFEEGFFNEDETIEFLNFVVKNNLKIASSRTIKNAILYYQRFGKIKRA